MFSQYAAILSMYRFATTGEPAPAMYRWIDVKSRNALRE
jgi:hypothetical protein